MTLGCLWRQAREQVLDTHLAFGKLFRDVDGPITSSAAAIEHSPRAVDRREYEAAIEDPAENRVHQLQSCNLVLPRAVSTIRGVASVGVHVCNAGRADLVDGREAYAVCHGVLLKSSTEKFHRLREGLVEGGGSVS